MHQSVIQKLEQYAKSRPNKKVVWVNGRSWSWAELDGRAGAVAVALADRGIGIGHRVALLPPDPESMIFGLLGTLKVGAIAAPLNRHLTAGEQRRVLADLEPHFIVKEVPGEIRDTPSVAIAESNPACILYTSGSTGRPKGVVYSHAALAFGIDSYVTHIMDLSVEDIVVAALPLAHAFGLLSSVLAPLAAGASIVLLDKFSSQSILRLIARHQVTVLPVVATMLRAILNSPDIKKADLSSLRYALAGAAACSWSLCQEWQGVTGAPVVRGYGMTEVIRPISFRAADLKEVPESTGQAMPGVSICVVDEDGHKRKPGETGQLWIRSPASMTEYFNQPEATADAFRRGWLVSGDLAKVSADGFVSLVGRADDVINRGGEKVAPMEVEGILLQHPAVRDAIVFSVDHPTLDEDMAAAIVPVTNGALDPSEIAKFARQHLADFKVPSRYVFVEEFPRDTLGKLQRSTIAQQFAAKCLTDTGGVGTPATDRPPTQLERDLSKIWARVLGVERVGLHDDFFSLGGDSLGAVELFLEIEKALGRSLPIGLLLEAGTVAQLAEQISSRPPMKCVVPIQPCGNHPAFFCVHDLSGEIIQYRALARRLGEDEGFYGVQSLGLDNENVPFTNMDDMANRYVDEIRNIQPHGPYYIGGYSFGGRVAFRMAQLLHDAQEEVSLLALIDAWSHVGRHRVSLGRWLKLTRERIAGMSSAERTAFVAFWIRRVFQEFVLFPIRSRFYSIGWSICQWAGRPMPRFLRNPEEANRHIAKTYRAQPYQGDAVLLQADRTDWTHADRHDGWRQLVLGGLEVRNIPGIHIQILQEPYVETLAKELKRCMEEARNKSVASIAEHGGSVAPQR